MIISAIYWIVFVALSVYFGVSYLKKIQLALDSGFEEKEVVKSNDSKQFWFVVIVGLIYGISCHGEIFLKMI